MEVTITPGESFGPWNIIDELGTGGNATVYRATHLDDPKVIALKVLHGHFAPEDLGRFKREYNALKMLKHPNIVEVFETGEESGQRWISMEYVKGETITEVATRITGASRRWEHVEKILRGLAMALTHIHEKGMTHRDIKPANVLVTSEGAAKLMDFGVVKAPDLFSTALTMAGRLVGTVAYMAPEQITGETIDQRADLYSLGAVLYVLLTNKRPIQADTIAGYLAKQLAHAPTKPSLLDSSVPVHLDMICMKLIRKSPDERFATAKDVIDALNDKDAFTQPALQGRESIIAQGRELILKHKREGFRCAFAVIGPKGSGRTAVLSRLYQMTEKLGVKNLFVTPSRAGMDEALEAIDNSDTVIFIDDLNRCNHGEIRQLSAALEAEPNGALVIFSAPNSEEDLNSNINLITSAPSTCLGTIKALSRTELISTLKQQGISSGAAALIGRRFHTEFGGLPKPSMEQLQALIDADWLHRREDGSIKPNIGLDKIRKGILPLPADIQREVQGRLNILDTVERNLLELLSVLDGEASTDLLSEMNRFRRVGLEKLTRTGVVSTRLEGLHEIVSITSLQLKQYTYDKLDDDHKVTLHREVAEGLLAHNPRRVGSIAEVVANHLLKADDAAQAWPLLVQAARRAARKNEHDSVRMLCEKALSAAKKANTSENDPALSLPKALLGNALVANGSYAAGKKLLVSVLDSPDELKRSLIESCKAALGLAMIELGDLEAGAQIIQAHLSEIEPGSPSRPRAIRAYGRCLRLQKRYNESIETFQQGLSLAQAQQSKRQEALCLVGIGKTLLSDNQIDEASGYLQQAERLLRETAGTAWAEALVLLGEVDFIDGRWRQSLLRAEEASIIAQTAEELDISARAIDLCSRSLFAVGMIRDSARLHDESIGLTRALETESALKVHINSPIVKEVSSWLDDSLSKIQTGDKVGASKILSTGLKSLPKSGARGLRFSLLVLLTTIDNSYTQKATNLAEELAAGLPMELKRSFRNRSDISVLSGFSAD